MIAQRTAEDIDNTKEASNILLYLELSSNTVFIDLPVRLARHCQIMIKTDDKISNRQAHVTSQMKRNNKEKPAQNAAKLEVLDEDTKQYDSQHFTSRYPHCLV